MLVSVLLSTRNRADRLALTLESFSAIRLPDVHWELVVADNGSSDHTVRVLEAWSNRLPLRHVDAPERGLSRGRNAAIAAARGELLVFTDDDVTVSSEWLAAYVGAFRSRGCDFFYGGPIDSDFEAPLPQSPWTRLAPASVRGLNWGSEERSLLSTEYFIGPNWACAAGPVRQAGGFDPRMGLGSTDGPPGGEEIDLMNRLSSAGLRSWYVPAARLRHWVPREKVLDQHIKARWEAVATVRAWSGLALPHAVRVGRVPIRVHLNYNLAYLRWLAARLGVGDALQAERKLLWSRGLRTGFRLPPR